MIFTTWQVLNKTDIYIYIRLYFQIKARVPSIRLRYVLLERLYPSVAYPWPVSITLFLSYMLQVTDRFGRFFRTTVVLFIALILLTLYMIPRTFMHHLTFSIIIQHRLHIITCGKAKFFKEKIWFQKYLV